MQVIYGINPVMEALRIDRCGIERIIVARQKDKRHIQTVLDLAAQKGVPVEASDRTCLEKWASRDVHQGVIALCKDYGYTELDDLLACRHEKRDYNLVLMLDGITDPQNLGSMIRTAHCLGANGLVIPEHRASPVTASAIKASAGAACHLPVAMVVNLPNTIDYLKEKGFWVYGADADGGMDIGGYDYDGHVAVVMGSEGRGIRPLVKKKCDFLMSIPMFGRIDSLNVSVAAGIILYEILQKWGGAKRR